MCVLPFLPSPTLLSGGSSIGYRLLTSRFAISSVHHTNIKAQRILMVDVTMTMTKMKMAQHPLRKTCIQHPLRMPLQ